MVPMAADTDRLAEIQARAAKATDGDWHIDDQQPGVVLGPSGSPLAVFGGGRQDRADADFTAHARQDMGYVLAHAADLAGRLNSAEAQLETVDQRYGAVHEARALWQSGDIDADEAMRRIHDALAAAVPGREVTA